MALTLPLIYFVDGSNVPVVTGNAYAERLTINSILGLNASTCQWAIISNDDKDLAIIAATLKLDTLFTKGDPVDDTQPLSFPLDNLVVDTGDQRAVRYYSIDEQKKQLSRAVANQIEGDLQKGSISQITDSLGSDSAVDIGYDIHQLASQAISRFLI